MTIDDRYIEALLTHLQQRPGTAAARTLDVRVGPFWVAVQTSIGTGVASTLAGEARPNDSFPVADAGRLHELTPLALAELARSSSTPEAAIGLAAVNALVGVPEAGLGELNAEAAIRARGSNRAVAVIGHFPFVDRLRPVCRELWVFEHDPNRQAGDLGPDQVPELLPRAEVVAITASTLVNHTLAEILAAVSPEAFMLMVGPSTPLCETMFRFGFDLLCGSLVVDPESVLRQASQGAVTRQIHGVRKVTMVRAGGGNP